MTIPHLSVSFDDVLATRERIAPWVRRTPVLTSRAVDERLGCRVFFKCEMFQRTGSFKARGAFSRLTQLTPEEKARGVVAFSSGNHGQAVALAARELGLRAAVVMPNDAPALKLAATRGYGARVVLYDRAGGEDRLAVTRRIAAEEGQIVVPAFDDDGVIMGQGTLAFELLDEVPDLDVILTPCGGGGLLSGVSIVARTLRPQIRTYGVEPETGNDVQLSFERGEVVTLPATPKTIADSLQPVSPAQRTLDIVRTLAAGILTVSDLELRNAMALAASRMKILVEPGGAAGFAALLHGKVPDIAGRRVGVVLSGGNVDLARFAELCAPAGGS